MCNFKLSPQAMPKVQFIIVRLYVIFILLYIVSSIPDVVIFHREIACILTLILQLCVRHSSIIIKYQSQLGIRAGWSCSGCVRCYPATVVVVVVVTAAVHHLQLPSYFPVITGFGAPHQAQPNSEGFEVRNFTARSQVLPLSVSPPHVCCTCADLWSLELRHNAMVRFVSLFQSWFSHQFIVFKSSCWCLDMLGNTLVLFRPGSVIILSSCCCLDRSFVHNEQRRPY